MITKKDFQINQCLEMCDGEEEKETVKNSSAVFERSISVKRGADRKGKAPSDTEEEIFKLKKSILIEK